jgi:hypothetical protein
MKYITLFVVLALAISRQAQATEIWIDEVNNFQLYLSQDGTFKFINSGIITQGNYTIGNNTMTMQDRSGTLYPYVIQSSTNQQLILMDQNGRYYHYRLKQVENKAPQINYPWENPHYLNVLSEKQGYQWRERENQLYVEFLQLLIKQKASLAEIDAMRSDFIAEFNANPQKAINDTKDLEASMKSVYSTNDLQQVALMREILATNLYHTISEKAEMNNYSFVHILNNYITILNIDNSNNLSLTSQDAQAYINYLQFQMMLSGHAYQLTQQERTALQIQISNNFEKFPVEKKQVLALASFIWENIERQWLSMTSAEQQNYVIQVQQQAYTQNNQAQVNNLNANQYSQSTYDYSSEMSASVQRNIQETDNQIYTMMQNNMMEDHVTMMNILNTDSNYEYVVEYNINPAE